jgi:beta-alanine--pyruvate transaminase
MVTVAKGLTSGIIPMGAVFVQRAIYDTFMQGPPDAIELFHGYTYSAHPIACATALATLDVYAEEELLTRGTSLAGCWADALHSLKGLPHVIDIRNLGLIGAIELEGIEGKPSARAFDAFLKAYEAGLLIRTTGDTIALSPPLIIQKAEIDKLFDILRDVLKAVA